MKDNIKYINWILYFDLNGNYRSSTLSSKEKDIQGLLLLYGITIKDNIIEDHLIQGWVYAPTDYSVFDGVKKKYNYACFDLNQNKENITLISTVDEVSKEHLEWEDTYDGLEIYTFVKVHNYQYSRSTEIKVSPRINNNTEALYWNISLRDGYYKANDVNINPEIDCSNCYFVRLQVLDLNITIVLEAITPNSQMGIKYTMTKEENIVYQGIGTDKYLPTIRVDSNGEGTVDKINIKGGSILADGSFLEIRPLVSASPLNTTPWVTSAINTSTSSVSFTFLLNLSTALRQCVYILRLINTLLSTVIQLGIVAIIQDGLSENTTTPLPSLLLFLKDTYTLTSNAATNLELPFIYHGEEITLYCSSSDTWLLVPETVNSSLGYISISYGSNKEAKRQTSITLTDLDSLSASTTIILDYKISNQTGITEDTDPSGLVTAIDDNTGLDYSSDSLIYKLNSANIYSTLASKDNTLFLGNYVNENFSLKLYREYEELFNSYSILEIEKLNIFIPIHENIESVYTYVPNMKLNSLEKKLFKRGEEYSLGLVCIHSTGTLSSVIHIGEFLPDMEPYYGLNEEGTFYGFYKQIAKIKLTSDKVRKLKDLGVRAVIPVYAPRTKHKVLGQGFLNKTVNSSVRKEQESITALYNWLQRYGLNYTSGVYDKIETESENVHNYRAEVQWNDKEKEIWNYNNKILTFNTPEMELQDVYAITDSELVNSKLKLIGSTSTSDIYYTYHYQLNINGTYLHSQLILPEGGYRHEEMAPSFGIWRGYLNDGQYKEDSNEFIKDSGKDNLFDSTKPINTKKNGYATFYVYPWQRSKIGGEGPESKIESKKFFKSLYLKNILPASVYHSNYTFPKINKAVTFRLKNNTSILKYGEDIYQGVIDYMIVPKEGYKAFTTTNNYPRSNEKDTIYAGYDNEGIIKDVINMRYNPSPHVVLFLNDTASWSNRGSANDILTAELYTEFNVDKDENTLESLEWIKCGNISVLDGLEVLVYFEEGDYFFGRFDSLRVYPYSLEDTNSITEIVSGMLCSRANLDARCDRNRGITTAVVTPLNFNLYNDVYSLMNNYFTYKYINLSNPIYKRTFKNSMQWSMTKTFGNEIDDWCNILDINTLDLDGDKGSLTSLVRFDNNIYAFLETGISLIMYNDQMQISTTAGVPIEIANSGKVTGKRYLYENIGCLNPRAIALSLNGVYFVDGINKSIYKLGAKGDLQDVCSSAGMKSWGLAKLDKKWELWYDIYSQEVLAVNDIECLAYHDLKEHFLCFLNYEGIYNVLALKGRMFMFKEILYKEDNIIENTLWKKNDIEGVEFFGRRYPIGIELLINPNPTVDKTFTNLEYRADVIDKDGIYLAWDTFDQLDVWNEYQYGHYDLKDTLDKPSNLKKKFRIWRANIPRAIKGVNPIFLNALEGWIRDITSQLYLINLRNISSIASTRDRMRNPWLRLRLVKNNNPHKMIAHDFIIQYVE